MEIALLSSQALRVKGKQVSLVINPTADKKIACDCALFFVRANSFDRSLLEGNKLIIDGAGDYEVGGVKVTGFRVNDLNSFDIGLDGIDCFFAKASALSSLKDIKEAEVVAIESDVLLNQSVIAALNASVLLFYGEHAVENIKSLGKEQIEPISKYSVTRDKLPSESQIYLLG